MWEGSVLDIGCLLSTVDRLHALMASTQQSGVAFGPIRDAVDVAIVWCNVDMSIATIALAQGAPPAALVAAGPPGVPANAGSEEDQEDGEGTHGASAVPATAP